MKRINDSYTRREVLTTLAAGSAALGLNSSPHKTADGAMSAKLGISSYSYWHFTKQKVPIEHVIDEASRIGVGAVDVLHRQMQSEELSYLHKLKRYALSKGITLNCLSIHQDFVSPDRAERQKHIDHTIRCLEMAHAMGIPSIRLNSGRWGTVESFDRLMELEGKEPPLKGYTNEDAFNWCIESIKKCIPTAKKYGVVMALENHWGLTSTAKGVLRIVNAVDSPWLGVLADTGNFRKNTYEQLKMLAPKTTLVSAKTYYGGGEWYTLDLDYKRIAQLFKQSGFDGYVTLEFEGKADPHTAVPQSIKRLQEAFSFA